MRRKGKGAMALQLIGAGFGRTGTLSLYTALNSLGLPCYHMVEVLQNRANRHHLAFWRRVAHGQPGQPYPWDEVFAGYGAAVDNPASCVWRELLAANPDAKVILTLHPRGAEAWYESTLETIYFSERMWQFQLLAAVSPFARALGDMTHHLVWQQAHRGTMANRQAAIAHYHQHMEDVKAAVPPERLLVYSVDQGWGPLCAFLDLPAPQRPFPHVNDRAEIKATIGLINLAAFGIISAAALGLAGLGWLAWGAAKLRP